MGASYIYFSNNIIIYTWFYKIQILAGLFAGATVYLYFYTKEINKKKEIEELKSNSRKIGHKIKKLIEINMGIDEKYELKEIVNEVRKDVRTFKSETREVFKEINEKMDNVMKSFTTYMIDNNERIGKLEGTHKATKAQVAIYVAIAATFAMMAINFFMSFKG